MQEFTIEEVRRPGSVLNYGLFRRAVSRPEGETEDWQEVFVWFWKEAPQWVVDNLNHVWEEDE